MQVLDGPALRDGRDLLEDGAPVLHRDLGADFVLFFRDGGALWNRQFNLI